MCDSRDAFLDTNGDRVQDSQFNVELLDPSPELAKRQQILDLQERAFLVDDLLTEDECGRVIEACEDFGFDHAGETKKSYRGCSTLALDAPVFVKSLWRRIESYLSRISIDSEDPHDHNIHGIPCQLRGIWRPSDISSRIQVSRYTSEHHFAPHHDGFKVDDDDRRTFVTVIVYLNGNLEGGSTNFLSEDAEEREDASGRLRAGEEHVIYRVKPRTGRVLFFNHYRLHEGEVVRQGIKYILLADVYYQRETESLMTEGESRALSLMREAERLETTGECEKAANCYRRAFKLCPDLENYV